MPTVYSNITSKEINAISRLSSAVLLKRNLDSFKLILTDPVINLILNNALSPQTRQNIDFSNSILKNYTCAPHPYNNAYCIFINAEKEREQILSTLLLYPLDAVLRVASIV